MDWKTSDGIHSSLKLISTGFPDDFESHVANVIKTDDIIVPDVDAVSDCEDAANGKDVEDTHDVKFGAKGGEAIPDGLKTDNDGVNDASAGSNASHSDRRFMESLIHTMIDASLGTAKVYRTTLSIILYY